MGFDGTPLLMISNLMFSIYDPLGLLTRVKFYLNLLVEKFCSRSISWDENAPSHISESWSKRRSPLPLLQSVSEPRLIDINT